MRTVVKVNEGRHPELYSELEQLDDPYGRAERLRMLATIGLRGLNSGELSSTVGAGCGASDRASAPSAQTRSGKRGESERPSKSRGRSKTTQSIDETEVPGPSEEDKAVRQDLLTGMASQF